MHVWTLLPKETINDDRAYFIGFLKSVFEAVSLTYLDRTATTVPDPDARPDLILNLVSAKRREALDDIEAKAQRYGVPVSPPSESAWRSEDKRTYLVDYPDVCPPTRIARDMEELQRMRVEFGGDVVVKDPLNHAGKGVERIRYDKDLHLAEQIFAENIGDLNELIVYLRKPPPGGWKSNIRGGGQVVHTVLTRSEVELALAIAPRAGLDNVSLDIGEHEGKIYLIETNLNYGGIIDFDLDRGTCNVRYCAEYLLHLARYGRHALLERPTKGRSDISPRLHLRPA